MFLNVLFSYLASGSGDTTVRFWDVTTETPHHVCKGIYFIWVWKLCLWNIKSALISSAQLLLHAIKKHICVQENFRRFLNTHTVNLKLLCGRISQCIIHCCLYLLLWTSPKMLLDVYMLKIIYIILIVKIRSRSSLTLVNCEK